MKLFVGTSGYQYKGWTEKFYPADLKAALRLQYYVSRFNSVEINASFYRLPEASTFGNWRQATPAEFMFSIKGSRYVTHVKRLREPEEPVERLFSRAAELGPKLGVVLWQFMERWPQNDDRLARLEHFCECLKQHELARTVRQAFELRHESWFNERTYALLRRYNFALVVNQSSKWPVREVTTADFGYFRFHGPGQLYASGYSRGQLRYWADAARRLVPSNGSLFAYFNNDVYVDAPRDALDLRHLLEIHSATSSAS